MNVKLGVGAKDGYSEIFLWNRTIHDWNQLPAEVLGTLPCKPNTLKKRVRKVINEVSVVK
jgi:hypothetical protein